MAFPAVFTTPLFAVIAAASIDLSLVACQPQLLLAEHGGITRVPFDEEGRGER